MMNTNRLRNTFSLIWNAIAAQRLDARLMEEQRHLLLQRSRVLCWLGPPIYLFTILVYDYKFYPTKIVAGLIASVPPSLALIVLFFLLRTSFIKRHYSLPLYLILGVFSNYAETTNLMLTDGDKGLFFFPYFLIFFTIAIYYPGPILWVFGTAASLIFGYIGAEWFLRSDFGSPLINTNIIYLIDVAVIGIIGNRVCYDLFIREKRNQIALEEANTKLQELDKAKTRFFSNVTHEFRTPLVALSSTIQMILDKGLQDIELQRKLLANGKACMEDMLENVNDLLMKARCEKGFIGIRWSKIEVAEFLERYLPIFETVAQKQGTRLLFTNQLQEPLHLYADSQKLKKILNNLVGNALKFTEAGTVEVMLSKTESHCLFRVKDTGRGIPREDLSTLFDPFTQASNNPLREVQGTGLGLAMVKDFTELHRGKVTVESEVGQGSLFTVSLPLGDAHVERDNIIASDFVEEESRPLNLGIRSFEGLDLTPFQHQDPQKQNILLVEDNPHIVQILAYILTDHYNLHFAKDGQDGIEKVKILQPDLILSDIMMPRKNGIELLTEIRKDPELRRIPVVLLTSKADMESKLQGLEEGADEYLSKPFNNLEIETRIKNILERKRMESEFIHAEKMIALGQIVSGISHEILNPISYAKSAAANIPEFLEAMKAGRLSEEKGKERLQIAVSNVEEGIHRVCDIAGALKGFVRKGGLGFQPQDLHEGIESTLKIFHANYKAKAQVHRQYSLKEKVHCRLNHLNQVFLNLLINAAQSFQDQGNIWITTLRQEENAVIAFRDDGPGISKEIQKKLFIPFFTTKGINEGMGLGLYNSQQIVQEHQGRLSVESTPGQGTVFTIQVPINSTGGVDANPNSIYDRTDRRVAETQYPYRG